MQKRVAVAGWFVRAWCGCSVFPSAAAAGRCETESMTMSTARLPPVGIIESRYFLLRDVLTVLYFLQVTSTDRVFWTLSILAGDRPISSRSQDTRHRRSRSIRRAATATIAESRCQKKTLPVEEENRFVVQTLQELDHVWLLPDMHVTCLDSYIHVLYMYYRTCYLALHAWQEPHHVSPLLPPPARPRRPDTQNFSLMTNTCARVG